MTSKRIRITASGHGTGRGHQIWLYIRSRSAALSRRCGLLVRNRGVRVGVAAGATAVLLSAVLLPFAPQAHAATTYKGKVTATLNVRSAPTTAATDVGTLRSGTTISIQCKVFGPSVGGNTLWYKQSTGKWVTARYVANIGSAPRFCGDGHEYQGRVAVAFLNVRSGPNTANATVSTAPQGTFLPLVCKVDSQVVGGNPRWYQLTGDSGGQWVAARYVSNVGSAPPTC